VPGGGNVGGRLTFEPAADLRDASGYGRAGTYDVGQWQQILLSNPFVTMALDHVLRPIADARIDVEPAAKESIGTGPGKLSPADAETHATFVRWALTERFPLRVLSKQAAQGFLLSGFALFEPVAEECVCPAVPGRTVFALRDMPQRLPNSLDASPWLVDDTGRLMGIRQMGPVGMSGRWERPTLPADRVLLLSWKREAGNFAGVSQLRSCWYLAGRVMPRLMKMVGVTLQREGPGLPVAYTENPQANLTPQQQEDIVQVFADMAAHEASGLVMPAGWRTEWTVSPAANKGHIVDVILKMGTWILMQFGAQQLMLGVNETGSRSVGETHDARSMAMVREVLGFLADAYNGVRGEADGLVRRLIEWNFGPQPAYPKVKLTPQRPELAPLDLASAASAAKGAGIFTPTLEDENSFRERAGFAPITEEQREEAQERAASLQPAVPPGVQSPAQGDDEDDENEPPSGETEMPEDEGEEQDRPADGAGEKGANNLRASNRRRRLTASAPRGGWVPWRPLRASEQAVPWEKRDAYFTAQRDAWEKALRNVVVRMLARAAPAVAAAMADGVVKPAEVAAIPLDTARLRATLKQLLDGVRSAGGASIAEELPSPKLRAAAGDEKEPPTPDAEEGDDIEEETTQLLNALAQQVERRVVTRVRAELEREAVDALRSGDDAETVVERVVSRQLETGAFRSDAGMVVTKAFNASRDEAARLMGGVAEVEYSALLDSSTCSACQSLDGATAPFGSEEHDRLVPPNRDCAGGDNCRCLLVFVPAGASDGGDE